MTPRDHLNALTKSRAPNDPRSSALRQLAKALANLRAAGLGNAVRITEQLMAVVEAARP